MEQTARDLGDAGRDDLYGYGALDAAAALGYESAQGGDDDDDASAIPTSTLPTDGYVTGAATRDAIPALLILGVASVEESGQFVGTTRWYSWSRPRYYLAASGYNVSPDPYLVNLALGSM